MHSAGIEAMSLLMDRIMSRAAPGEDLHLHATNALSAYRSALPLDEREMARVAARLE